MPLVQERWPGRPGAVRAVESCTRVYYMSERMIYEQRSVLSCTDLVRSSSMRPTWACIGRTHNVLYGVVYKRLLRRDSPPIRRLRERGARRLYASWRPASACSAWRAVRQLAKICTWPCLENALIGRSQRVQGHHVGMIWYGHLHCKGGYPSLLARRYRPHGHSDELSHTDHRSQATPGHPRYRQRGPPAVPRNTLTCMPRTWSSASGTAGR